MRKENREAGFGLRKRKFKKKKRGKERGRERERERERDVGLILNFFGFVSMLNFVFVI